MKATFLFLTLMAAGSFASPVIGRRQNDVQKCEKGIGKAKDIQWSSSTKGTLNRGQRSAC